MKNITPLMLRLGVLLVGLIFAVSVQASSVNLTFAAPGGSIVDSNGVATGFTARMPGTGSAIVGDDTNLVLDVADDALIMHTSPGLDFNGSNGLTNATVVGFELSTLGFKGTNDFFVSATFTNLPDDTLVLQPDELCLVVGTSATNLVRAGFINFDVVNNIQGTATRDNEDFACNNTNGLDADNVFFGSDVGIGMNVQISRVGGVWTISVNGRNDMPNSTVQRNGTPEPPLYLDSASDLFVGVCAEDVFADSPWSVQLKNFSVNVIESVTAPVVGTQPVKQIVNEGNPVTFSVGVTATSASPRTFQWLDNNVPLAGETNSTLTFFADATNAGLISVAITNALGSTNSLAVPLFVVLPTGSFTANFASTNGGLLDASGLGAGFPSRLPGTGTIYTNDDPNLALDTNDELLNISSTSGDFNLAGDGGASSAVAEAPGVSLNSLGFTGSQDVNANLIFPTLPGTVSFDSAGLYIGQDTNFLTRAGWIDFTAFSSPKGKERYSENIQPSGGLPANGGGQYFGFGFDPAILPMTVQINRTAGVWNYYIDGVQWNVLTQPILNNATNLTAGVFVYDTGGGSYQQQLSLFQARVFSLPALHQSVVGGQLTLTWNVAGGGLQQNSNLNNPAGWTPVVGATSPYTIPLPKTGTLFYRLGL